MRLVASGRSNKEIAHELRISQSTAQDYVHDLIQGLGLRTRVELTIWAVQNPKALAGAPAAPGLHRAGCECKAAYCTMLREAA